jgi:anti-sigma factor RsiW
MADPADDLACIDAVELVTDFIDGALPHVVARRLERHLETCPGCTDYVDQLRTIAGSLAGVTDESLPPAVRAAVIAAFRER